jgi:hypothetical protein
MIMVDQHSTFDSGTFHKFVFGKNRIQIPEQDL